MTSSDLHFDQGVRRYGPFDLAREDIVALHDFVIPQGGQTIRLVNEAGGVDLGISLHFSHKIYQTKSEAVAASWFNGPGEDEYLLFDQSRPGPACIAVWKRNADGIDERANYYLEIGSGLTDAPPPSTIARAGIEWIAPNPFNPRVVIAYRLAVDEAVSLRVYDVAGRLVRTLLDETRGAGQQQEIWDGIDADGKRVASGPYFIRLETPSFSETRKAVMVK